MTAIKPLSFWLFSHSYPKKERVLCILERTVRKEYAQYPWTLRDAKRHTDTNGIRIAADYRAIPISEFNHVTTCQHAEQIVNVEYNIHRSRGGNIKGFHIFRIVILCRNGTFGFRKAKFDSLTDKGRSLEEQCVVLRKAKLVRARIRDNLLLVRELTFNHPPTIDFTRLALESNVLTVKCVMGNHITLNE